MANDVSKSLTNMIQNAGAPPYALMTYRYKLFSIMWHIYSPSLDHFSTTEELLDLIPMKGTTTGKDFMRIFEETFEKYYLQWDK